ncbi:membrane protein [Mycobacterium sp. EPa45]|nr:membrane protein [Mycobacterium sp. EPa45]
MCLVCTLARRTLTIIAVATSQTASTRAKDSDRNDTCQILDTALSEGQLSMSEHQQRVKEATTATTLGDLRALVSDLQTANAPVQLPTLKKPRLSAPGAGGSWGIRLAIVGVLIVLGIGIGWGLYGNTPSPLNFTSDPGAKSDGVAPVVLTPPRQLHSLGGLNGLLEQMKKKFGDTQGNRLVIYPDYASLTRPDPNDDRRELNYTYRGGWGDPSTSAASSDAALVDLSKFDAKAVVGVLRGAPETLNMKPGDVKSTYLIIEPSRDPTAAGTVTAEIYVSSDFGSGYIQLYPDGTVKQVNYP